MVATTCCSSAFHCIVCMYRKSYWKCLLFPPILFSSHATWFLFNGYILGLMKGKRKTLMHDGEREEFWLKLYNLHARERERGWGREKSQIPHKAIFHILELMWWRGLSIKNVTESSHVKIWKFSVVFLKLESVKYLRVIISLNKILLVMQERKMKNACSIWRIEVRWIYEQNGILTKHLTDDRQTA